MNEFGSTKDVTAVICSWNSIATIKDSLSSLRKCGISKIFLVDADSTDGTRETAHDYADEILSDPRQGLATARNIGIAKVSTPFVLNWGADNVMPEGDILQKMLEVLQSGNYSGVSSMTLLLNSQASYLHWAMNQYKIARFFPGQRNVIGTPTLFYTKLLQDNPYDNKMSWSDDGDLCDRLSKKGHKFAIVEGFVYEIGTEDIKSIVYRWKGYGKSDWETFTKNSPDWGLRRKIYSLSHPLRNELLLPFIRTKGLQRFALLPFLIMITLIRYIHWIGFALKSFKHIDKYAKQDIIDR